MKKIIIPIVIILFLVVSIYTTYTISYKDNTQEVDNVFKQYSKEDTPEGRREAFFDFLVDAIKNAYCGIEYKQDYYGYEWVDIIEYYRPRVLNVESDEEFIFLCREMLSLLNDGHTDVVVKGYGSIDQSLPIGIEKIKDGFYLYAFNEVLEPVLDKVDIGDRLIKIDGKEIQGIYNDLLNKTVYGKYSKTEPILVKRLFRSYYYYLKDCGNKGANLVFEKKNGETYELNMQWSYTYRFHNMYGVVTNRPQKIGLIAKRIDNTNIGYIKIDKWASNRQKFEEEFEKLKNTDAMIIDVRNNGGGDFSGYGQTVLSKFLEEKTTTLYKEFRDSHLYHIYGKGGLNYNEHPKEQYFKVPIERMPAENTYCNQVVLLTNEFHFSSNDLFITAFNDLDLGEIIGRLNPFQSFGQPIYIETPWNGWNVSISVMIPYSPTGEIIEDRSIEPDIYIPLTEEEIVGKADPILNSAVEYLKEQVNNKAY